MKKQEIRFQRNRTTYSSRAAAIAALPTIPYKAGEPHLHCYTNEAGVLKAFMTIGLVDGIGEDVYQLIADDIEIKQNISTFTCDDPIVVPFGDIQVGETFDNVPVETMLRKMLYPYTKPTISLTCSPSGKTMEKGTNSGNILMTASVVKKSDKITSLKFYKGSTIVKENTSLPAGGSDNFTVPSFSTDIVLKATVTDERGNTVTSSSISYKFVYPAYVGTLISGAPTQGEIKALTKKVQSPATFNQTFTFTDARICIAVPPGWGGLKMTDPNGFDITDSFVHTQVAIVGTDSSSQMYDVYINAISSQSNFKVTFTKV